MGFVKEFIPGSFPKHLVICFAGTPDIAVSKRCRATLGAIFDCHIIFLNLNIALEASCEGCQLHLQIICLCRMRFLSMHGS